jgi:hypothetical protein
MKQSEAIQRLAKVLVQKKSKKSRASIPTIKAKR